MSKIEWTGKTWNPTLGCKEVSPGCTNCYAARMAFRLSHMPAMKEDYAGLTKKVNGKIVWTGLVKEMPARLLEPLYTNKPTVWFVDSMSDLFHKDISFEFIDKVFVVMKASARHTFQILTKRVDRMVEYFSDERPAILDQTYLQMMQEGFSIPSMPCFVQHNGLFNYPLRNVWIGASVENQKEADERIPSLIKVPIAVRFLSCEPLLGPVDLKLLEAPVLSYKLQRIENRKQLGKGIDWVICGGESGPGARPMHPDWARSLRDQCKEDNVSFFFKQWGEWLPINKPWETNDFPNKPLADNERWLNAAGGHGFHGEEVYRIKKVGKKKSGRLLDEVEHNDYPKQTPDLIQF